MPSKSLKVAVVSDLHFVNSDKVKDGSRHSWLTFNGEKGLTNNFWQSLIDKVKSDSISADILVCPGDITTHSEKSALQFAWKKLNELANTLGCEILVAATGNHDVNSRGFELHNVIRELDKDHCLVEDLKQLSPIYPLVHLNKNESMSDHINRIHYFGSNFLFSQTESYNLITLNSCSNHTNNPVAYEKGFVSKSTHQWLESTLQAHFDNQNKKLGLLVCHHHPIQHPNYNLGSYDFMNGGVELLEMLNRYGNWIVIHGHKHHGKISYFSDGSKRTVVFAAGTLSCHKESLGDDFANQFYVMDIDPKKTRGTPQGVLDVYSWQGNHWGLSKRRNDGVFTGVGFGFVGCLEELAEDIANIVAPVTGTTWNDIIEKFPNIKHCVPKDLKHLEQNLLEYNIDFIMNDSGEIEKLEKTEA
ncbi:metallophosphoesterase family protein [Aliivibrio finisterrensis]|uniref:Metallophosphoesterase n=1 Tax=Aliivibrio finisterrensis TaxID=511998 RepID=A0A6N6RS23_9GAMM|nr:metallophosphoesterase [Aliivibrio finisterrensis]KAB2824223.1 metallophosphoesterase [Aliivibrio finisterrensis]